MSLIMITPSLLLELYIEIKRELCYFSEMKKKIPCALFAKLGVLCFLISFRLFEGSSSRKIEKLKTLLCYFRRVTQTSEHQNIIFNVPLCIISFLSRAETAFSSRPPRAQRSCYVHKTINKQSYKLGKVRLSFLLS